MALTWDLESSNSAEHTYAIQSGREPWAVVDKASWRNDPWSVVVVSRI